MTLSSSFPQCRRGEFGGAVIGSRPVELCMYVLVQGHRILNIIGLPYSLGRVSQYCRGASIVRLQNAMTCVLYVGEVPF